MFIYSCVCTNMPLCVCGGVLRGQPWVSVSVFSPYLVQGLMLCSSCSSTARWICLSSYCRNMSYMNCTTTSDLTCLGNLNSSFHTCTALSLYFEPPPNASPIFNFFLHMIPTADQCTDDYSTTEFIIYLCVCVCGCANMCRSDHMYWFCLPTVCMGLENQT